jgi:RNA polymerase sigma factor (sigma-70 family)
MSCVSSLEASEREHLILAHLPQVRLNATRMHRRCPLQVDLDDLVSVGTLGLIQAVDRFRPERGCLPKTLAEHRIRGAILDYLRKLDPCLDPRVVSSKSATRQHSAFNPNSAACRNLRNLRTLLAYRSNAIANWSGPFPPRRQPASRPLIVVVARDRRSFHNNVDRECDRRRRLSRATGSFAAAQSVFQSGSIPPVGLDFLPFISRALLRLTALPGRARRSVAPRRTAHPNNPDHARNGGRSGRLCGQPGDRYKRRSQNRPVNAA